MEYTPYAEAGLRTLFRRCVACPDITPSCPTCASDEVCSQISETCTQCASRVCIKSSQAGTTRPQLGGGGSKGPNVGGIAGGVIGGVLVIAIATWLIWRFFIKNKQQVYDDVFDDEAADEVPEIEKTTGGFSARRSARASTHTVESFASSAFTRASNVIQIAFIPGITDRSGNSAIVSPVPPVPIPTSNPSPSAALSNGRDHYFMPSDLRDSTFTGYSDDTRASTVESSSSSFARQSLTPSLARGSVASTIFNNSASVISAEAVQTAHRGRAAVVSVQRTGTPVNAPTANVPAVPKVDYRKYGGTEPADSTQLINLSAPLSTSTTTRAAPGLLQPTIFNAGAARSRGPTVAAAAAATTGGVSLTAAITEATRRASLAPTHGGLGSLRPTAAATMPVVRDASPFSDEHAI